jgi:hypothetical protein
MATTRADERHAALEDALVDAALEALSPLAEAGAPAWADVMERAAALVDNPPTSMPEEATWPLPIRNRRTT